MPSIEASTSIGGGTSSVSAPDQQQQQAKVNRSATLPQSPAIRPEDLGVTPWYLEDSPGTNVSQGPLGGDRGPYPSYSYIDKESNGRPDLTSTRNSSVESSDIHRVTAASVGVIPRKAYMDLRDAIALLDETCPNQDLSPSLTPRTPRTPLTPYPRNKRARSKSSDNSSNYSNDRLSDRSFETGKSHQDKDKKRPFLRKIGISKTEDRPFLAKLAPRIIGKPYLEKIGPSKAVEKPFLDKIGSSRTLDKFTFETPRIDRKPLEKNGVERSTVKEEISEKTILEDKQEIKEEVREEVGPEKSLEDKANGQTVQNLNTRRRSGKGLLLKMYSFETEDLHEATVQLKEHREPLRGASLDDVLDSGPSSLPPIENSEGSSSRINLDQGPGRPVELLKCRVTTSEEIISSSASFGSPREANSWSNTPLRRRTFKKEPSTSRIQPGLESREGTRSDESTPNSPTKRSISKVSPERVPSKADSSVRDYSFSPTKTRRQTLEDRLDQDEERVKHSKQNHFERRGISSDNLLTRENVGFVISGHGPIVEGIDKRRETSSEDSLAVHRDVGKEYTRETFKQLQDKFEVREIPTETYAGFKRRTRMGNMPISTLDRLKINVPTFDTFAEPSKLTTKLEDPLELGREAGGSTEELDKNTPKTTQDQTLTVRSALRKQEGIDHASDQEGDLNSSLRRPKRRIFHEPSQETMDLLTELRKVKSLLKTPSWERDYDLDKKPTRLPKRILLTDKEFCLSVERENSIRRPSRSMNILEKPEEEIFPRHELEQLTQNSQVEQEMADQERETRVRGPALFEKRCLSLDYADDVKPEKPETRAISLASTRNLPSEAEEAIDYSDLGLICDSKSYSSDVFNTPSEDANDSKDRGNDLEIGHSRRSTGNHCPEVDIAIPIDQKLNSPKMKGQHQSQGRTSDLYEIISPRSTPFRVKKRLGKISVEESVKPESFTLGSKVDCQSTVAAQKRTKCFPL